jgi:ribosomal-protein-alanine N-acetyltransferase
MKQRLILVTQNLLLRPFEAADAEDVRCLAGDRAIADTTLGIPYPYEAGMAESWISSHPSGFESGRIAVFAIVRRLSGELAGAVGLRVVRHYRRAELGFWIGRPFWNKGYCTEAGRVALDYGFTTLRLNRIHASCFSRNPASARVLQKLGMVYEGRARQHAKKWNRFEDIEFYGILKARWEGEKPSAPQ